MKHSIRKTLTIGWGRKKVKIVAGVYTAKDLASYLRGELASAGVKVDADKHGAIRLELTPDGALMLVVDSVDGLESPFTSHSAALAEMRRLQDQVSRLRRELQERDDAEADAEPADVDP